jgi:hypothetical protein
MQTTHVLKGGAVASLDTILLASIILFVGGVFLRAMSAHIVRAILFASATITIIRGLRASIRAIQEPEGAPLRTA